MAQKNIGLRKPFAWDKFLMGVFVVLIAGAIINAIVHGIAEGNFGIWLGVLALVCSVFWYAASKNNNHHDWWYYTQVCFLATLILFFVVVPFLHLGGSDKVWIVDGKTTISHGVLWRSPFSRFATSISRQQDVSFFVSGKTKDGTVVVATLSGEFSIIDDEKVVIKRFGKMRDPDTETADMLKKVLQKSFEKAIGKMTVTNIVMAKNNFAIEHAIATKTAVNGLGLVGNGPIVVSGLHPYFGSK